MSTYEARNDEPRPDEWAKHRSLITDLSVSQDKTLSEIIRIMRKEHQFYADRHAYKKRLIRWGVTRGVKEKADVGCQKAAHQGASKASIAPTFSQASSGSSRVVSGQGYRRSAVELSDSYRSTSKLQTVGGIQGTGKTPTTCVDCFTQTTPHWQHNLQGQPLCYACSVFFNLQYLAIATAGPASSNERSAFKPRQLPPGWISQWYGSNGKYYYVQLSTGVSQWEAPTAAQGGTVASDGGLDASRIGTTGASVKNCSWFLKTPQYGYWFGPSKLNCRDNILWIIGEAGVGKSTLLRFLFNTRQLRIQEIRISYVFHRYRKASLTDLYRSLLIQLLEARPDLQNVIQSTEPVQSLLIRAIRNLGKTSLICFIDEVDVCKGPQVLEIVSFLELACEQAASTVTGVRICLASRTYLHRTIRRNLSYFLGLPQNDNIIAYISSRLSVGDGPFVRKITSRIERLALGSITRAVYLVDLLNKEYAKGRSPELLYRILHQRPGDVNISEDILATIRVEDNMGQLPQDVQTLKPKTICNKCLAWRLPCDKRRPACTNCIRLQMKCTWNYPPRNPNPIFKQKDMSHQQKSDPKVRKITHRDIGPSPSKAGWGTLPDASGVQTDEHVISNDSIADTQTGYNCASDHSDVLEESYIDILVDDIIAEIGREQLSAQIVEKMSRSLPTLLETLALKIGYRNQAHQRNVMVFIYLQREEIATIFKSRCDYINELDTESTLIQGRKSTEEIDYWLASTCEPKSKESHHEPLEDGTGGLRHGKSIDEHEIIFPDLEEYRKLIVEDSGYMWMLARLRHEIILATAERDILYQIRDKILRTIPRTKDISRNKSPEAAQATFAVDWDIMNYLHQQGYNEPYADAIANSITLTGSHTHAQALTCQQYMAQVWPLTGPLTLRLIQETLKTPDHKKTLIYDSPCRMSLEASIINGVSVVVTVLGLPDFVVEIGEQLAWLGSALQPPLLSSIGVSTCTPFVDETTSVSSEDVSPKVKFAIKFKIESCLSNTQRTNGQCWSYLFSNPIIARGFPILHRAELDTGLEMPLELMAALTGTKYVNTFKSNIFIKGFNTMLVPIKRSETILVWHLLHSQDPSERISYLSSDIECTDVTITALETSRHVLGWCTYATSIVGTTLATYNIERSRIPRASSQHRLEKFELTAGQIVTGTAAFTLGNREKPVHISRFGFLTKLQWISSKYVVLWDEGDKRGWLVNGASALLHILRASLAHSKRKFQSAWLLDPSTLEDYKDLSRPEAALYVLINEKNRNLTLFMDKTEVYEESVREGVRTNNTSRTQTRHYRLEDKIEHIYNMLEKLIDYQTDLERRSGLQISIRPRRQLEGWDFQDLVKDGDPIFARATTLPTIGKGWVDFVRAIRAVTLFGRGFGELIQPRRAKTSLCTRWSLLPKESYYLAACVYNLLEIMETDGDVAANPRRLCENIIWHTKGSAFDPCPCTKNTKHSHHDPVQALFPLSFTSRLKKKAPVDLKGTGAVIFGHNMSLHWHWTDVGDPVKGDPPPEQVVFAEDNGDSSSESATAAAADSFEDSGMGSSLGSPKFLSPPDPSTSGSTGGRSPTPNAVETPSSSQDGHARGPKRALQSAISSVSKKLRR